jgi:broad specificity phosphatase PhoE
MIMPFPKRLQVHRPRIVLALAAASLLVPAVAQAQKLVLIVRHAERADGGAAAGQMQAQTDPPLSPAGEARAAKLAGMLADAGITAIYGTQFRRTRDTAAPLASKLGIAIRTSPSRETDALVASLRAEHAAGVVLIVGHSNSVPALIKAFGGPDVTIGENEYDNLFVVVPATGTMTRIRFR